MAQNVNDKQQMGNKTQTPKPGPSSSKDYSSDQKDFSRKSGMPSDKNKFSSQNLDSDFDQDEGSAGLNKSQVNKPSSYDDRSTKR